jgi:hypothetical protein
MVRQLAGMGLAAPGPACPPIGVAGTVPATHKAISAGCWKDRLHFDKASLLGDGRDDLKGAEGSIACSWQQPRVRLNVLTVVWESH